MDSYDNFYRENKQRVFSYLFRLTGDYHQALDFMQESFTRYFSRYGHGTNNIALLYTIARNAFFDSIRKHRDQTAVEEEQISSGSDPEQKFMEKQAVDRINAALQKLDPVDRELIALLTGKSLSYKEIGNMLNISESNVKVKVHRARLKLKKILEDGRQ